MMWKWEMPNNSYGCGSGGCESGLEIKIWVSLWGVAVMKFVGNKETSKKVQQEGRAKAKD